MKNGIGRDFQAPGRSVAVGRQGMAATSHPAATLAAVDILRQGGNAMDAAIAACAVQCVVEPAMTGIGGDCFVLYAPGGGAEIRAYNGAGRAPAATDAATLRAQGLAAIPHNSPHAVTVPGAVDAWATLSAEHGSMPLSKLLGPAIEHAEGGFAVTPRVAFDWAETMDLLRSRPTTAATYLIDGRAPVAGDVLKLPALGRTLRAIAESGRAAFYEGPVAAELVSVLRDEGGVHTGADFAAATGCFVTPIETSFRQYRVHECPPPGQGIIALLIMNILSQFSAKGDPMDPARLHLEIEAARLAYAVRGAILAEGSPVTGKRLLSPEFAAELAGRISPDRVMTELPAFTGPEHRDTVYLTVVDRDRNVVSFINSVFDGFGSGILAPESGVLLHNRGMSFSLDGAHPNTLAAGRQPMHTIIPGMMTEGGRVRMAFGVMGGHFQAMGQAHLVTKVVDYGMDLQSAMSLPRLFPVPGKDYVEAEATLPEEARSALVALGHKIVTTQDPIGGAQAIWIDEEKGVLYGGSEPRKDGFALGY
ncbi:MAG TPA: gamma-glutamyltransferase family protein [Acidisoma sp.]|uniref:gamma-glutamyltransferase family protein n=1 Tax=Acidisoma sp. TaxID=1872115 RepID=UPI002CCB7984|nr:gamma-glutamyltransferase family protein [Acidisoma sp.]HTI01674.1 gamma-glutamyltransferase family protein [Acidisoma sp.]